MPNKAEIFLADTMKALSADQRKQIKPEPLPLAKKWGELQIGLDKKLAELEALDKSLQEVLVGLSVSYKKILSGLPKEHAKEGEILHRLLNEYDNVFKEKMNNRMSALNLKKPFKM